MEKLNKKLLERKEAERLKYKNATSDRDRNYAHGMMLAYGQAAAMARERMAGSINENSGLNIPCISVSFLAWAFKTTSTRESNWYDIDVCTECTKRLSDNQKMYSGGICPKCGINSKSTVCNTRKVVLKRTIRYKWWQPWNMKSTYVGKNKFSKRWVNER